MVKKYINKLADLAKARPKKLTHVTVAQHATAIPSSSKDQQNIGLRADYYGEYKAPDNTVYNKFAIQANAGSSVPPTIKEWIKQQGKKGTHTNLGDLYVKKDGTKEDIDEGFEQFKEAFSKGVMTPTPTGSREPSPARSGRGGTPSRGSTPPRAAPGTPPQGREAARRASPATKSGLGKSGRS
jgi:hypothetical protein